MPNNSKLDALSVLRSTLKFHLTSCLSDFKLQLQSEPYLTMTSFISPPTSLAELNEFLALMDEAPLNIVQNLPGLEYIDMFLGTLSLYTKEFIDFHCKLQKIIESVCFTAPCFPQ